jgi:signal transduction histidine kinase
MSRLVDAVQELSLARDLESIMSVVRRAARELTGADGATFVLREGDECYYADENAIAPLWKGQRFPMKACVSGWAMLHKKSAVIEDIFSDPRIPADAYRPTFVKSLVMVPIRPEAPIGAIGNYWATRRAPRAEEVALLEALANTTAVALENVRIYQELEQRVKERTAQLQLANRELEAFAYAVSHDLGAPLRSIRGFAQVLSETYANVLPEQPRVYLQKIQAAGSQMRELMDDLLELSRVSRGELAKLPVDLSALAREVLGRLQGETPERKVECHVAEGMTAQGDPGLLRVVLDNLLSNAWKYTGHCAEARIDFGVESRPGGPREFFVRDNGTGFDMQNAGQLFQPFRRLHTQQEFRGSGIGLATVRRIIQRHGGWIRAEAQVGKGATFYFMI